MSRRRCWVVVAGLLLLLPTVLFAQSAAVKRKVNLRTGPSTSFSILRLLLLGDELTLLEPGKTQNYYEVRVADGDEGWVWANNVRVLADGPAIATPPAGPPEIFNGCGLDGNPQHANRRALNRLGGQERGVTGRKRAADTAVIQ